MNLYAFFKKLLILYCFLAKNIKSYKGKYHKSKYRNQRKITIFSELVETKWQKHPSKKEYKRQLWHFQWFLKVGISVFWTFHSENVKLQIK